MKKLSVSFVLPNYNGKNLLKKHLTAVKKAAQGAEIIVVDDASVDGSVEYLKKFHHDVIVVAKKDNSGFSGSVDAGASKATGDIIVLLNTDVEPEIGFLLPLLEKFSDEKVFAVGCFEVSHDPGGNVTRGRGIASWQKGFYIHTRGETDRTDTAWVSGGSGAFRKSVWNMLGGMDQIYNPFYWEDIDLSYRARKAGYNIYFEPASRVHHYHEIGAIKSSFSPRDVKVIAARNQFTFIWKNITDRGLLFEHIFWTPIRIMQSIVKGDTVLIAGFIKAFMRIPLIAKRRYDQSRIQEIVSDRVL